MLYFKGLACVSLCLAISACTPSKPPVAGVGFEKMSRPEIVSALVGNSLDGADKNGDYVIYYPSDSEMRIFYQGRTDSGVWRIKKNKYCRKWTHFGKGKERCVRFYRKGGQINWVRKGKVTDRTVLVGGNPAAL